MRTFVVAKALVVNDKGEVLLLRRSQSDERRPGQWDLPGGWVEPDEDFAAAAAREAAEEAGIKVTGVRLVYALSDVTEHGSGTWLLFATDPVPVQTPVTLSFEHDAYEWMLPHVALSKMEYHRQRQMLRYVSEKRLLEQANDADA